MDDRAAIKAAAAAAAVATRKEYKLTDFVHDAREDVYYNVEDLSMYRANGVCALIPKREWETAAVGGREGSTREVQIKPSTSIARAEHGTVVECTTHWPGMPRIIKDVIISGEGLDIPMMGRRMLNTYQAPVFSGGMAAMAGLWIEHVRKLWPEEADTLLDYFAHTIQRPFEKINFCIVLVGAQGIGKDMMLMPIRMAVGEHNALEISPDDLHGSYNPYASGIMVVINEARPTAEDFKATDFYEKLKVLTTSPPNWLKMNGKYQPQRWVRNLMRVIITTNTANALYVPADDRRLFFASSKAAPNWANSTYYGQLYGFYKAGGFAHIQAYLMQRDISKFNPTQSPVKNEAHNAVLASWTISEIDPIFDALEELGWPPVFFAAELLKVESAAFDGKDDMKRLMKSSRKLAMAMGHHGYTARSNAKGWQFRENGKRFVARVAFIRDDFDGNFESVILARGKEVASAGKAARPSVIPIKPL